MTNTNKPPAPPQQTVAAKPRIDIAELRRQTAMRIIEDGASIAADLLADTTAERRQFPEQDFKRIFLPVITGAAFKNPPPGYTPERIAKEARNCWLMVAGGEVAEVDVIKRDGTVAFTMPALSDSGALDTIQRSESENMKFIEEEFRHQQGLGAIAEQNLIASLNQRLTAISVREPDRKEAERKLSKMREFYGLEKPKDPKEEKKDSNSGFMGEMFFD